MFGFFSVHIQFGLKITSWSVAEPGFANVGRDDDDGSLMGSALLLFCCHGCRHLLLLAVPWAERQGVVAQACPALTWLWQLLSCGARPDSPLWVLQHGTQHRSTIQGWPCHPSVMMEQWLGQIWMSGVVTWYPMYMLHVTLCTILQHPGWGARPSSVGQEPLLLWNSAIHKLKGCRGGREQLSPPPLAQALVVILFYQLRGF